MEDFRTKLLIKHYRKTGSPKAKKILVRNHQAALKVAAGVTPDNILTFEDKIQYGNILLLELISKDFNLRRKIKFNTYLITYVKQRIIDEIRRLNKRHKGEIIRHCELTEGNVDKSVESPSEFVENKDLLAKLEVEIARLPYTEQVVMGCIHQGMKMKDIAEQSGVSISRISQIVNVSRKKLKNSLLG